MTFDLWNTLIHEGSGGLLAPRAARWQTILEDAGHALAHEVLERAHRDALGAYQDAWIRNEQFRSAEAVTAALLSLGLEVPQDVLRQLEASFHEAGLASVIEPAEGAVALLADLNEAGVRTAIVCDIGLTPSSALRELLEAIGVLQLIDVQTWSDDFGVYKPSPKVFLRTLAELGVEAPMAIHVGDRLRTDVAGARGAGMVSVRYRGIYDDPDDLPEADHVIDDLAAVRDLALS